MHIEHSYSDLVGGAWLRGNLHAHSTRSDGRQPQQVVIDDYAALGYDFLMLADHDIVTTDDDLAKLDGRGMVLIPGYEITANGVHMLHVNSNICIEPLRDRQLVISLALEVPGSLVIVNHPNWEASFTHCRHDDLQAWQGYCGIEIYNGLVDCGEGSALATDHWDRLLSRGRRAWGFANDDLHDRPHCGAAWNMVYAKQRTVAGVVDALAKGRFYASTGVTIDRIAVEGTRITIESRDADRIAMYGRHQRRLARVDGRSMSIEYPAGEPYVRFECLGRGGRCAWTQPFFLAE